MSEKEDSIEADLAAAMEADPVEQERFVATDDKSEEPEQPEKEEPDVSERQEETTAEAEPEAAAVETEVEQEPSSGPPTAWRAEAKAMWDNVPAALKDEILKREDDVLKGIGQYKQGFQAMQEFQQLVSPYMPDIRSWGVPPDQAITMGLQFLRDLNQNPQGVAQQIMQQSGIDPEALNIQQQDPQFGALQNEIAQLKQQLTQGQQEQAQAHQNQMMNLVNQFTSDPSNKYATDVQSEMVMLLQGGFEQDKSPQERLRLAYDKACRLNDSVSAAIEAEQRRKAEAGRKAKAKAEAEAAKKASAEVQGQVSVDAGKEDLSVEELIRQQVT